MGVCTSSDLSGLTAVWPDVGCYSGHHETVRYFLLLSIRIQIFIFLNHGLKKKKLILQKNVQLLPNNSRLVVGLTVLKIALHVEQFGWGVKLDQAVASAFLSRPPVNPTVGSGWINGSTSLRGASLHVGMVKRSALPFQSTNGMPEMINDMEPSCYVTYNYYVKSLSLNSQEFLN